MSRAYFRKNGNAREWVRTGQDLAPVPSLNALQVGYAIGIIAFVLWCLFG